MTTKTETKMLATTTTNCIYHAAAAAAVAATTAASFNFCLTGQLFQNFSTSSRGPKGKHLWTAAVYLL